MQSIEIIPENGVLSDADKITVENLLTTQKCTLEYKYKSKYKIELKFSKFSKNGCFFLPSRGVVYYKKYKYKSKTKSWEDAKSSTTKIYIRNLVIDDKIKINYSDKYEKAMSNHIDEPCYFNNPIIIKYDDE